MYNFNEKLILVRYSLNAVGDLADNGALSLNLFYYPKFEA